MIEAFAPELLWIIVLGFIVSFVLAFGIGANDVANSFGTSVGSKVLSVRKACCLATVFEILGAVLIGYKVSDTMRKGILQVSLYENDEMELMLGNLSALAGSAVWLILATFLKLPISGTHSIVGATIGFSLVARGTDGLQWTMLGTIIGSWFISPVLSGIVSVSIFLLIRRFILSRPQPITPGLRALPLFYGITILINVFSIVHDGPRLLYFNYIPWWGAVIISVGAGLIVGLIVQFVVVPWQRRTIFEMATKESAAAVSFTFGGSAESSRNPSPHDSKNISAEDVTKLPTEMIEINKLNDAQQPAHKTIGAPANTQMYHFAQTNGSVRANGYLLAETAINGKESAPNDSENGHVTQVPANGNTLVPPQGTASGQVSPAYGLSPNSSAVPLIKEKLPGEMIYDAEAAVKNESDTSDSPEVSKLFSFLQVMTATFGSFAHGGNDVSNAIGPLVALWLIYHDGSVAQKSETPIYILLYGGAGIALGLWVWGRRVIKTIGEDLTKITPSTGFTIEIGAAFTVLLASKIGLPISTTHCKVGSVVFVGWASSSKQGVDWKLFRNIIFAWVVTVPVAGGLSAAAMAILRAIVL